ncbi:MAG: hypothetical protein JO232_03735 [Verrucomicrobia bacterium]|nr:hypothetical protein [Verrucomicrobiota bacterium]
MIHFLRITPLKTVWIFILVCILLGGLTIRPTLAKDVVVGVDIAGIGRNAEEQDKLLKSLHDSGVRVIRWWIGSDASASYEFLRKAHALGIKIELTVWIVFPPNAPKRAVVADMPWMFGANLLSTADVELTRSTFQTQLNKLEDMGIEFVAFELGNEMNNPSFNGDFTLYPKGVCTECKTFGLDDLKHDPEGQKIAAGFRNYVKLLAAVKDVRDHSRLNRHTPVLLGGLADEGPAMATPGSRSSRVSVPAAIEYMREFGLDDVVDGYGVHTYPWSTLKGKSEAAADIRNKLEEYVLSECKPAGSAVGKPCWITEWGLRNNFESCPVNDSDRAALVREYMVDDLRPHVQQGSVVGLLYFVWQRSVWANKEEPFSIYRCGGLTESGRLAIDASLLQ